ncbi:hypothetical protein EMIHUDRAFT_373601, partial [Emiliania huxleyi CCMP1516]|uniref:Uncharacterized protein n=2 Tax=Emiliania huxleyi TaxID=2903 RepID=A0A0D3K105_EMIH1
MNNGEEYGCRSLILECTKSGGRRPPLLPSAFAAELETKSFTNGKVDKPLSSFGKATELNYDGLGWGDAEAAHLAEVLASGAAPRLETLKLCHNQIGDEGCTALAAALKEVARRGQQGAARAGGRVRGAWHRAALSATSRAGRRDRQ